MGVYELDGNSSWTGLEPSVTVTAGVYRLPGRPFEERLSTLVERKKVLLDEQMKIAGF